MRAYCIYILLFSLSFTACTDSPEEKEEIVQAEPTVVDDLSYQLTLSQSLESPKTFALSVKNHSPIECILSLTSVWDEQSMNLELITVKGSGCDSIGTIETFLDLEPLAESSKFTIQNNVILNEAAVEILDSKMTIKLNSLENLVVPELSIYRIPENIAWGYVRETFNKSKDIERSYYEFNIVAEDLRTINNIEEGNYGYFKIEDSQTISIDGHSDYGQIMLLDLDNANKGWTFLTMMLEEMKNADPNIKYHFTSSDGEVLSNN